jgi:hypothetical protein
MTTLPEPAMLTIFDGRQQCLGFVLRRGSKGWEAFDSHDVGLGVYPSKAEAAAALTIGARGAVS